MIPPKSHFYDKNLSLISKTGFSPLKQNIGGFLLDEKYSFKGKEQKMLEKPQILFFSFNKPKTLDSL